MSETTIISLPSSFVGSSKKDLVIEDMIQSIKKIESKSLEKGWVLKIIPNHFVLR